MLTATAPRGHRHHQLRVAAALADVHLAAEGHVLDVGTGTGWVLDGLAASGRRGTGTDIFTSGWRARVNADFVVASTESLPFRPKSFTGVTAFASLGAFDDRSVQSVLAELHEVLQPGGRLVCLVSHRHPIYDRVAVHRLLAGYRWNAFDADDLVVAAQRTGFAVLHRARRGGPLTLLVEWAFHALRPLARSSRLRRLRIRIGEFDRTSIARESPRGRYLYLVLERS